MKMEAVVCSEVLLNFNQATQHYISGVRNLRARWAISVLVMSYIVRFMSVANQTLLGVQDTMCHAFCDFLFYSLSHCAHPPHYYIVMTAVLLTKCYSSHQIKEGEMGGACGTYMGGREMHSGFWWRSLKERNNLEELGVGGMIMLKWMLKRRSWVEFTWLRIGSSGGLL